MAWFEILTSFSLFLDLFAIFELIIWVDLVIRGIKRAHIQQLYRRHMHTLYRYGIINLIFPIVSINPLLIAYGNAPHANIVFLMGTLYGAIVFYSLTIMLWCCVVYLRFHVTREIFYCYLLPEDAHNVRILKFLEGMHVASQMLPHHSLKREYVDPLIRSIEVTARLDVFPKGKKEKIQLTNDFRVYCDLAVDAFGRGYNHYEQLYQEGSETLGTLNGLFKDFPQIDDKAQAFLNEYAATELGVE